MKNSCKKHTVLFIILVILIALASSLSTGIVQSMFAGNLAMSYWAITLCKGVFSVIPLTLMVKWGSMKISPQRRIGKGFLLGAVLILFMLPNLLLITLIEPILIQIQWGTMLAIVCASLSIGLLEETAIRGVMLPLFCEKWHEKKHVYLKAAVVTSLLFACIHLNWSVRYFLANGHLTWEYLSGNLYQVYYTFAFGMLAAGVTMYAKSIWPMVFWHGMCDFAAFFIDGIMPPVSLYYYHNNENVLTFRNVLRTYGISLGTKSDEVIIEFIINLILVLVGIHLLRKAEFEVYDEVKDIELCRIRKRK